MILVVVIPKVKVFNLVVCRKGSWAVKNYLLRVRAILVLNGCVLDLLCGLRVLKGGLWVKIVQELLFLLAVRSELIQHALGISRHTEQACSGGTRTAGAGPRGAG